MKSKIYQIDAFTDKIFTGNPAAVCPLNEWLSDDVMQKIAMENNLAETAFYVKEDDLYHIRWFTPKVEVDLCGHATLAAAYVLFNHECYPEKVINFYSKRSGKLSVTKNNEHLALNFPVDIFQQAEITDELKSGFNLIPKEIYKGKSDYLFVYETENQIQKLIPNLANLVTLDARGVIATAKGENVDFVSRFFAPQCGVDEDPVTGSAHTTLTPFWSQRLHKNKLTAIQLSERMGYLTCEFLGDRVEISGKAKLYLIGEIFLSDH